MTDGLACYPSGRLVRNCTSSSMTTVGDMWSAPARGPPHLDRGRRGQLPECTAGGRHSWRVPVTAFWQAHRDAAWTYSELISDWAQLSPGMTAWDLYGGVGVFAAVLADAVGESGRVITVDSSRAASRAARAAFTDMPQVR